MIFLPEISLLRTPDLSLATIMRFHHHILNNNNHAKIEIVTLPREIVFHRKETFPLQEILSREMFNNLKGILSLSFNIIILLLVRVIIEKMISLLLMILSRR